MLNKSEQKFVEEMHSIPSDRLSLIAVCLWVSRNMQHTPNANAIKGVRAEINDFLMGEETKG